MNNAAAAEIATLAQIAIPLTKHNLTILAEHYELEQEDDLAETCARAAAGSKDALGWVRYELSTNGVRLPSHVAASLEY